MRTVLKLRGKQRGINTGAFHVHRPTCRLVPTDNHERLSGRFLVTGPDTRGSRPRWLYRRMFRVARVLSQMWYAFVKDVASSTSIWIVCSQFISFCTRGWRADGPIFVAEKNCLQYSLVPSPNSPIRKAFETGGWRFARKQHIIHLFNVVMWRIL